MLQKKLKTNYEEGQINVGLVRIAGLSVADEMPWLTQG